MDKIVFSLFVRVEWPIKGAENLSKDLGPIIAFFIENGKVAHDII